jgi:hypothetical protein
LRRFRPQVGEERGVVVEIAEGVARQLVERFLQLGDGAEVVGVEGLEHGAS